MEKTVGMRHSKNASTNKTDANCHVEIELSKEIETAESIKNNGYEGIDSPSRLA